MKREDLKKLGLEDEAIESVMKLHGQTVNGLQEQVTALQASEANLKSQNEKHEKDLKTLQKDNDELNRVNARLSDDNIKIRDTALILSQSDRRFLSP